VHTGLASLESTTISQPKNIASLAIICQTVEMLDSGGALRLASIAIGGQEILSEEVDAWLAIYII